MYAKSQRHTSKAVLLDDSANALGVGELLHVRLLVHLRQETTRSISVKESAQRNSAEVIDLVP
jgi:hypothetical protein